MVARDDSVIRGSLIACMIFLVLSIALNFFLWRYGDTRAQEATDAATRLQTVNTEVRNMENKLTRLKAMLGFGGFTQAQIDEMKQNASEDPEMQAIEEQYTKDMSFFGVDVEPQDRNYSELPKFLVKAVRDLNTRYADARQDATKIRTDAEAEIANAETSKQLAEQKADEANKKANTLASQFDEDRARMNLEKEETRDKLNRTVQDFGNFRKVASDEKNKLAQDKQRLLGTIVTQKVELNKLRSDQFETTQGEVRFVDRRGGTVTINLGSGDALRPGVTFGVIDGQETRLQDAKVKATIQITQIQGTHLALARIVAQPEIRYPIIPGDKIYSPFWAPGRRVKIALAGEIDIDGDGKPDNEALKGQIKAAGAIVAAEIAPDGTETGLLDSSVRFLVVGESPEVSEGVGADAAEQEAIVRAQGEIKARATEMGVTVIPAWKLQSYLKAIDDTLTTPLGSAVRGEDFPPDPRGVKSNLPSDISELYKRQTEGMQQGNKILPP